MALKLRKNKATPSTEYELTNLDRELVPAIAAIVKVGQKLKLGEVSG